MNAEEDTIEMRKGKPDAVIQVAPNIWFGPYDYTFTKECVEKFTHIVNCDTEESSTSLRARVACKFRHYPSLDHYKYPILDKWMPQLREFAVDEPCLFLHCYAGSNRSAALAIALAVERTDRPLNDVLSDARKSTTRAILDNTGFVRQLVEKYGPHH